MNKYFIFSDVHSHLTCLMDALKAKGFKKTDPSHVLVCCGDFFDRGPESYELYVFIKNMLKKKRLVWVRGNHEDLLIEAIHRRMFLDHDYHNMTVQTAVDLVNKTYNTCYNWNFLYAKDEQDIFDKLEEMKIVEFIEKNTVNYYELGNYICVHGFLPVDKGYNKSFMPIVTGISKNWRNESKKKWEEARWYNGMEMYLYDHLKLKGKTIVCGHFHAAYGNLRLKNKDKYGRKPEYDLEFRNKNLFKAFKTDDLICLDACTARWLFINVIVIEN